MAPNSNANFDLLTTFVYSINYSQNVNWIHKRVTAPFQHATCLSIGCQLLFRMEQNLKIKARFWILWYYTSHSYGQTGFWWMNILQFLSENWCFVFFFEKQKEPKLNRIVLFKPKCSTSVTLTACNFIIDRITWVLLKSIKRI